MTVKNSLTAKQNQRIGITAYLTNDAVKQQINSVIGGKDGTRFISSIVSSVNTNPALQECTNQSILSGALLGESLKLSPSHNLVSIILYLTTITRIIVRWRNSRWGIRVISSWQSVPGSTKN